MVECLLEVTNDLAFTSTETKRVTKSIPKNGSPAHGYKTLYHDIEDIFLASQSSIKKRQSGCHQHHKTGANDHKDR